MPSHVSLSISSLGLNKIFLKIFPIQFPISNLGGTSFRRITGGIGPLELHIISSELIFKSNKKSASVVLRITIFVKASTGKFTKTFDVPVSVTVKNDLSEIIFRPSVPKVVKTVKIHRMRTKITISLNGFYYSMPFLKNPNFKIKSKSFLRKNITITPKNAKIHTTNERLLAISDLEVK